MPDPAHVLSDVRKQLSELQKLQGELNQLFPPATGNTGLSLEGLHEAKAALLQSPVWKYAKANPIPVYGSALAFVGLHALAFLIARNRKGAA